jgi:opacity protein-like surface antigen
MKKATLATASMLVLASANINLAAAADLVPAPDTSEWRFTLAPYVWGVGLSGDVGVFGRGPVDVDIPFSDILENLDFAAMGVAEAHNGTWGVFVDLNYTSLSAGKSRSRSLERDIFEQLDINAKVSASADIKEFIGTVMGQWRAVDSEQMTLDLMAGARYWYVDNDIEARVSLSITGPGPLDPGLSKEFSGSDGASWVDPMVGVKSRIDTTTPVYFTGWGMIGGFGVGSDINWDVMGGVGYEWTDHFSTVLGYRALGVDYKDDGFVYDIIQQGVALGAVINF